MLFDIYNALKDEPYLGLKVICFISVSNTTNVNVVSLDIPILDNTDSWKSRMKKSDQFIIALEDNEEVDRNNWLRYFFHKWISFCFCYSYIERLTFI